MHLPVTRDGETIDVILVGQVYESVEAERPEEVRPARPDELAADQAACDCLKTTC
ncbi:hypothetical protein [Denitrobaculum tricleocarpae]|uniref:hypothetical protein n=1 Tax=Denitrobaculum tricleocarpae TaxID=2591009 RepID=UPI0015D207C4|nr:hypothetical protein [Denitrobaculum tricleocarpae]